MESDFYHQVPILERLIFREIAQNPGIEAETLHNSVVYHFYVQNQTIMDSRAYGLAVLNLETQGLDGRMVQRHSDTSGFGDLTRYRLV